MSNPLQFRFANWSAHCWCQNNYNNRIQKKLSCLEEQLWSLDHRPLLLRANGPLRLGLSLNLKGYNLIWWCGYLSCFPPPFVSCILISLFRLLAVDLELGETKDTGAVHHVAFSIYLASLLLKEKGRCCNFTSIVLDEEVSVLTHWESFSICLSMSCPREKRGLVLMWHQCLMWAGMNYGSLLPQKTQSKQ